MKPRIFIGSSTEGVRYAKVIEAELNDIADCTLWNEGFFENNRSSFESLSGSVTLFDFAILIASQDDVQLKKEALELIARDNIIFEFGLCVGRLGTNRSFLFREKGVDLPSDLFGITVPEFVKPGDANGESLQDLCKKVKKIILDVWKTFELSFVPSTALAVGYFDNFVSHVCRELKQSPKKIGEKSFSDFKLHIVIPDELPNNFNDQVIAYLNDKHLKQMEVETNTRKYNFYLDYSADESSILKLYDLPTTLSALKKSIETAFPKGHVGESERERILKQKEMNNFCGALTYLVKENPITKRHVEIEFIDIDGRY